MDEVQRMIATANADVSTMARFMASQPIQPHPGHDGEHPFSRPAGSDASMFIQWKGTTVCMDFVCKCGFDGHLDSSFAYVVECPECGALYEMGTQVIAKRIALTDTGHDPKVLGR